MSKPTILTVDDDAQVSAAIARDLSSRYGSEYRVVRATSGAQALSVLARLALRDQPVALIAADQRMPEMTGIELMEQSRTHAPGAKLLLLTAYADTDVAISAINEIGLDYYLLKPWDPPEDRLYPIIDDLLGDWRRANPVQTSEVRIVGHRWSERSHDLKTFLARNHVPYAVVRRGARRRGAAATRPRRGGAGRAAAGAGARRRDPPRAVRLRRRRRSGPARPGRAAAVRRVHRRRRAGRSGRRRVRGVRGAADRAGGAGGAGRPGGAERLDRELPRLPARPERGRPRAPGARPGVAVRGGDGGRAGGRRLRDPGPGPRGAARRVRRDRGPGADPGHRRLVPPAAGRRDSTGWSAAGSTTAPTPPRPASAPGTTSTSSARPTPPARRR